MAEYRLKTVEVIIDENKNQENYGRQLTQKEETKSCEQKLRIFGFLAGSKPAVESTHIRGTHDVQRVLKQLKTLKTAVCRLPRPWYGKAASRTENGKWQAVLIATN